AFLVGIFLSMKRAKERRIDPNIISNLAILIMISSILGGRGLYILYHLDQYRENPLEIFAIWQGGLMIYGGILVAFLSVYVYLKKKKLPVWRIADITAPSLALGLAFGRLGCFFNGCCFGKPTQLPWGIHFPPTAEASYFFPDQSLHPTQLYSSLAGLFIFFLLLYIDARSTKHKARRFPDGYLFFSLTALYSIWRFGVDFLRGYEENAYLFQSALGGPITINQLISLILLLASLVMIFRLRKK
ncbi:prolipoprotein diacylglyceryl transferase, partial [candidate division TA06 bacterium]|nr:prolipoprotein diacylglyceryl transferase [candidate division TA06 bacterium]